MNNKVNAVYVHIPFCKNICSYCDFCKIYYDKKWINKYLINLDKEVKNKYKKELIKSIYIGGGTPSQLDKYELEQLFNILKIFNKSKECEFTFECNVEDIDEELLIILKNNNVNRLSIGVQTFNEKQIKFLNRKHTKKQVFNNIKLAKSYGFNNISVDLIYAISNENLKVLKKDIKLLLKLNVQHISAYSMQIEKGTKLYFEKTKEIDEEQDYLMYKYINKKLSKNKYYNYEISNYSKKNYESKHNINYWENKKYYGFGLGASGYIDNIRYQNTKSINNYISGNYILEKEIISDKLRQENEIMLGLRLSKGINIKNFNEKYKIDIIKKYNLEFLFKEKVLIKKEGFIFISQDKRYILNEILLNILYD